MSAELRSRVERVRAALTERPDGYTLGNLPDGLPTGANPADLPPGLRDVLEITDGARGGAVVLFSADRLANQNFSYDDLDVVDDPDAWLRVGTTNDEPLLLHRKTGELWWFPDTGTPWYMSDRFERLSTDIATFVIDYLLGDGYPDIAYGPDRWYEFLVDLGLATSGGAADTQET